VTVALSVTIWPQFAIECLRRSNQQGVGNFGHKFRGCSPWSRSVMLGLQRAKLFGEIIFEEFQPMWSRYRNVTDRQTDRQLTVAIPRLRS